MFPTSSITKTEFSKAIIGTKPILGATLVATVAAAVLLYNYFNSPNPDPNENFSPLVKDKFTLLKNNLAIPIKEGLSHRASLTTSVSENSLLNRKKEKNEMIILDSGHNRERSVSF